MRRAFIGNLSLLLFLNFLVKPFWIFGIDRSIQNVVGAQEYGLYYALFNLSFLFNILLDLGITNYNNRHISQNEQLIGKNLLGVAYLKFGGAVLYSIVTFSFAWMLGYEGEQITLLSFLCLNMFILSGILFLRSNISGLQLFKTDSLISVLDRLLLIFICGFLLWAEHDQGSFQIEWLIYAQSFAYGLSFLVCLVIVLIKSKLISTRTNYPVMLNIIRQSFPFAAIILFMTIYYKMDAIMLDRMLDDDSFQAGIYAQGYRILDAFNMVGYLFVSLLFPLFSNMLSKHTDFRPVMKLSSRLLIGFAVVISALCLIYAESIMNLLYVETDVNSAPVFACLMLCFIPISMNNVYGTLLTANGNLRSYNKIALLGIGINLVLNLSLIPFFESFGSALASLVTNTAVSVLILLSLRKNLKLEFAPKLVLRIGLLFFATSLVALGIQGIAFFEWEMNLILSGLFGLLFAFTFQVIGTNSVMEFLRLKFGNE
jgi:O-antigen/teichoic acid export membrane protein